MQIGTSESGFESTVSSSVMDGFPRRQMCLIFFVPMQYVMESVAESASELDIEVRFEDVYKLGRPVSNY